MLITTTNYADFRKLIAGLFGDVYITFYGNRGPSHQNEVVVVATDKSVMVMYTSAAGLPETFTQEFVRAIALTEIGEIDWGS